MRKTTTKTSENKQDVPNKTPICWNNVTNPTNMSVRKRRMRLGLMVASLGALFGAAARVATAQRWWRVLEARSESSARRVGPRDPPDAASAPRCKIS